MKRFEGKGIGQYIALAMTALTLSMTMVACGNKDNGGPAPVVSPYGAGCVGCPASSALVASVHGKSFVGNTMQEQAQLSLNFYGDAAALQQGQASGSLYYRGTVAAGGVLRVRIARGAANMYECKIPVGDYAITTLTPGQWQGQQFSDIQLQAQGPTTLQLTLRMNSIFAVSPATVDWAGATFPYRLQSDVYVMSILGGQCNAGGYAEYYFGF